MPGKCKYHVGITLELSARSAESAALALCLTEEDSAAPPAHRLGPGKAGLAAGRNITRSERSPKIAFI